ncbi:hypothetical protein NQZ79_g6183 [Umbelopsis isabellina]|nr:hypothetical protein NQZ79_g6183 [Umbelopsis isabellina]
MMDLSQQDSTALGDESFTSNDQDMQANAFIRKHEIHHGLLLTQPFTPIFSSEEGRLEEKPLEEVDAFMEEPLFGKNYNDVAMHEQEIIHYENIEPQHQREMGTTYVPTEIPSTKYEFVDLYREIELQVTNSGNLFECKYAYIQ